MDYAQSRLQARFGQFPDERLWQELEGVRGSAAVLEIANASGLKPWVAGIVPHAQAHATELALRARWRAFVTEIIGWMPGNWQGALLWLRELADFPAILHLARGTAPLHWMSDDPVLQIYAGADATNRAERARRDCCTFLGLSPDAFDQVIAPAAPGDSPIGQACLAEWRRRWPKRSDTAALDALVHLFGTAMKQATPVDRSALARELRALFRRSVLDPVVAFIYIALLALHMERLRSALLREALAHEGIVPS